jgi:predicted phosphodiesterase
MAQGYPGPIHIVFGNNDGDQLRIAQNAARHGNRIRLYGEFAILPPEEFGIRIAVNHYPAIAEGLAASGKYDLVCYGHDHTLRVSGCVRASDVRSASAALINPGTILGYNPIAAADVPPTFVKLDTAHMTAQTYEVQGETAAQVQAQNLSDTKA